MKVTGPSNHYTRVLIRELWKTRRNIWKNVSEILGKPARIHPEINLYRLNKITKDGDICVIPGKILGSGNLDHKITVGTLKISDLAKEKLAKANCNVLTIEQLVEKYPTGSGVRIIV
ncbi:MAG: 50S ribosomal protein L18e [archaeon]|nr:50S ribosomal protein L18e [archaeon]